MAIKIADADDLGKDGYLLTVDLDADAPPDPDDAGRILTLTWGSYESSKNDGETNRQYENRIERETRHLAREAAKRRGDAAKPREQRTKVAALVGKDIT